MKNEAQQRVCQQLKEFHDTKEGEAFEKLLNELFRCPLLFPMGTGEQKGQFLLAQQNERQLFSGFTDMEEAGKLKLDKVDFMPFTLEEYSRIIAKSEAEGLVINLFHSDNCIINKKFFQDVVVPAFEENRVMPALQSLETKEITMITKIPFVIGRSEKADLVIPDQAINPIHSLIIEKDNHYYVVDRDSLNGVYVNGNKVEKEQQIVFDDVIEFCDVEYVLIPMGLATRQPIIKSIYGDAPTIIANGMFMMQNRTLPQTFLEQADDMLSQIQEDAEDSYRRAFLMSVEMVCAVKEKELKIEDQKVIEEQRKHMLRLSLKYLEKKDFGFALEEHDGCKTVLQVSFPKAFQTPGLAKGMYLVEKEDGEKIICLARIAEDGAKLIQIKKPGEEIDHGNAPEGEGEMLEAMLAL